MEAFAYLSVLLSIIIGLAMTQVLQGYRALLLARGRVRLYFVPLLWSALILLFAAQSWWASFGLSDHRGWSFAAFAIILLQTVLLYMMAGVALPDVPAEGVDLHAHYAREAQPLFGFLIAMLATSLAKDWLLDGRLPGAGNLAFHLVMIGVAALGIASRRPRVHQAIVLTVAALTTVYIAALFARL